MENLASVAVAAIVVVKATILWPVRMFGFVMEEDDKAVAVDKVADKVVDIVNDAVGDAMPDMAEEMIDDAEEDDINELLVLSIEDVIDEEEKSADEVLEVTYDILSTISARSDRQ